MATARGKRPAELDAHGICPDGFGPVWEAFSKLSRRRQCGFGAQAISYSDMSAYQSLYGVKWAPWQVEAIEAVDALWLAQHG